MAEGNKFLEHKVFVKDKRIYKLILQQQPYAVIRQWGQKSAFRLKEKMQLMDSLKEAKQFYNEECERVLELGYEVAPKELQWVQKKLFKVKFKLT
jgi:hypothetical protein